MWWCAVLCCAALCCAVLRCVDKSSSVPGIKFLPLASFPSNATLLSLQTSCGYTSTGQLWTSYVPQFNAAAIIPATRICTPAGTR